MPAPIQLRVMNSSDWRKYRELRLRALGDSPDAYGSTLAAEQDRSEAAWAERLAAAETSGKDLPLIAEHGGQSVGLVWAKVDPADASIVNVFQMWVAPENRGCGTGQALLRSAIAWARGIGARFVQLGVTCGDSPAARLYAREGFSAHGVPEPLRPDSPLLAQYMRLPLAQGLERGKARQA
jgi:GNAT superfamily N-acetyltransferase